jgi:PKD repeat protein
MIIDGTAYWASIKTPNTTFEPMYTVNLVVDEATANDFATRGHTIKQMDEGSAVVVKR